MALMGCGGVCVERLGCHAEQQIKHRPQTSAAPRRRPRVCPVAVQPRAPPRWWRRPVTVAHQNPKHGSRHGPRQVRVRSHWGGEGERKKYVVPASASRSHLPRRLGAGRRQQGDPDTPGSKWEHFYTEPLGKFQSWVAVSHTRGNQVATRPAPPKVGAQPEPHPDGDVPRVRSQILALLFTPSSFLYGNKDKNVLTQMTSSPQLYECPPPTRS